MNATTATFLTIAILSLSACGGSEQPATDPEEQAAPVDPDAISIRADLWCPFNCEPEGEHQGFMIDVARAAFALEGRPVDYQLMSWARAIEETRAGRFHAIVGAYRSDAPDFIFPAEEIGISRDIFLVRDDSRWTYSGIGSLSGVTLGVIHEYGYGAEVDAYVEAHKDDETRIQVVFSEDGLAQNFRKLLLGRITAVVENENRALYYLDQNPRIAARVRPAGSPGQAQRTFIAFSPARAESRELAGLLDTGIRALRASGRLAEILAYYGLDDWK
ncbi:MAG: transporter substrate-binding domain-containing protein [Spirochaetales bacterium]|nr:transporter substrate-binding domain-containing protein [Leptospiraceae bacterium]MCP5481379.1 transporter substrate-binding domain-containing protein [Spirochaetales bacterium]MCP5486075.1 transporter substrate-binding domain-containing protein [Spirochaetales bacterium]